MAEATPLIHPSAVIDATARLGAGVQVAAGAVRVTVNWLLPPGATTLGLKALATVRPCWVPGRAAVTVT